VRLAADLDLFISRTVPIFCLSFLPSCFFVFSSICPFQSGEEDLHDRRYTCLGEKGVSAKQIPSSAGGLSYTIMLCPNDEFFAQYQTRNPLLATWGAVAIDLVTSLIFFSYDFFVRKEFSVKRDMLQAKREFLGQTGHAPGQTRVRSVRVARSTDSWGCLYCTMS